MTPQDPYQPARKMIAAAIAAAGGGIPTARACGVTHQAVSGWLSRGRVPLHHVVTLCEAGSHCVTVADLLSAIAREHSGRGGQRGRRSVEVA